MSDISSYSAQTALSDINNDCGAGTGLVIARKEQDWWQEYIAGYGGKNFGLSSGISFYLNLTQE